MKNLIRKILKESLDWVSKVGSEREQIMDDLEVRIKTMDWDVDLERESERTTDGGWYFGRLWCGDEFYELYEYEDTFTIKFYIKEYGDYRLYDIYQDLTSRELMLGMTKIIVECLGSEVKNNLDKRLWHDTKTYKFNPNLKIKESDDFGWIDDENIGESPNYQGYPQGVVYLRDHDEIDEFLDLIINYGGLLGKGKNGIEVTRHNYHQALEHNKCWGISDRYDNNWVSIISASFFVSKKDPSKYDTGYWDYGVDEDSVQDWLDDHGCKEEVIDCENWKIYTDISQVRTLLSEKLTENDVPHVNESNDMDWVDDIDSNLLYKPYVGMMFHTKNNPKNIFEIVDLSSSIIYYKRVGTETKNSIPIIYFNRYMKNGDWVTYYS